MSNSHGVTGFQFDIDGMDISGASGGSADAAGFDVATGPNGVLGVSFSGASIDPSDGLLTSLSGSFTDFNVTLTGLIVTTDGEGFLHLSGNGSTESTDAVADCAGTANGDAVEDECGVCNGFGIADGECDCDGNIEDCLGICGGVAFIDECEECNPNNSNNIATIDLNVCGCGQGGYGGEGVKLTASNGYAECYYDLGWNNGELAGASQEWLSSDCDLIVHIPHFSEYYPHANVYFATALYDSINTYSNHFFSHQIDHDLPQGSAMKISTVIEDNSAQIMVSNGNESTGLFIINGEFQSSAEFIANDNDYADCIEGCDGEWYNDGTEPHLDCNGDCDGEAFLDNCEVCAGGISGQIHNH
jgi:hypothetical protein